MSKSWGQRIVIAILAVVMLAGTIGSFVVIILQDKNAAVDARQKEQLEAEYRVELEKRQEKVDAQSAELSDRYYDDFSKHSNKVGKFSDNVDKLKTEDIVKGSGEEIKEGTPYHAYYIGWTPDGEIFDQSIDGDKLKAPLDASMGLISGWTEGVIGMKIGGVRMITMPSDMGYGEQGTDTIGPNTPLRFIVMAIESPEDIPEPEMPEELIRYYQQGL